jgi:hypothetical protein
MINKNSSRTFRTAIIAGIISLGTSSVCMAALNVTNIGGYATLWDSSNCSYIGDYTYSCHSALQIEPLYLQGPNVPAPLNANCPGNARRSGTLIIGIYGDGFAASTGWTC